MTTRITVQRGDLTRTTADVLVNATTSSLLGNGLLETAGPGVVKELQRIRESNLTDGLPAGGAVATNAGNLPAKWIVHTVAPVWDAEEDRSDLLASCYVAAIELADKLGALSIVFPALGVAEGWSVDDAARIAFDAIASTDTHLESATFVIEDDAAEQVFASAVQATT